MSKQDNIYNILLKKHSKLHISNIIEPIIKDINFDHPIYIENSSLNDIIKEIRADQIKNYLTK